MNVKLNQLLRDLLVKHHIFISYHHRSDQVFYNQFSDTYSNIYGIFQDNSLDRVINSDDTNYIMWRIRQNHIKGTTCTIVLCGPETRWRKYVDWEIKASLDKQNGLIGIILPNNPEFIIPERLQDNIVTGYGFTILWEEIFNNLYSLRLHIEAALKRPKTIIDNTRPLRRRNS